MTTALGFGDRFLVFSVVEVVLYLLLPAWFAVTFAIATTALGVAYLWYDSTYWKRHGVPAVKGNIFLGSTMKFLKNGHLNDMENFKNFDRTYGDIIFGRKNIVSMDLDLIRSVMVKEFPHFVNRLGAKDSDPKLDQRNVMRNVLTMKKGEEWKRVRNVITPAFTTGKMRKLVPLLEQSANELRWVVERCIDEDKEIPLKDTMGRVSLDMIARCGFAVNINAFDETNESPFIKHAKD
ncbi:cytochrome CYP354A9, partial [Aphelenchoides avenae]